MSVTYLVTLQLQENEDVVGVGEEIKESLIADGFAITTVHPWNRPSLNLQLPEEDTPTDLPSFTGI